MILKLFSYDTLVKAVLALIDATAKTKLTLWWEVAKKIVLKTERDSEAHVVAFGEVQEGFEKRALAITALKEQAPLHEGWLLLLIQLAWAYFQRKGWSL